MFGYEAIETRLGLLWRNFIYPFYKLQDWVTILHELNLPAIAFAL